MNASPFISFFLTAGAAALFALAHPGLAVSTGIPWLGAVALVPVFTVVRRECVRTVWLWGLLYGGLSYGLFAYWLAAYHPYTIYIGVAGYGMALALVFTLMRGVYVLARRGGAYAMALAWCVYEYAKTQGFLGVSYGILGYTQWRCPPLLACAALGGVWVPSLLCAGTSAVLADVCWHAAGAGGPHGCGARRARTAAHGIARGIQACRLPACGMAAAWAVLLAYGCTALRQHEPPGQNVAVACVQNNTDSTKYELASYRRDVEALMRLTDGVLSRHPGTQLVVWPETAVVPPITLHYGSGGSPGRRQLVAALLEYIDSRDACFVLGNQETAAGADGAEADYNAVLVFDSQRGNVLPPAPDVYRKMHLVPFAEYFPYGRLFPRAYNALLQGDSRLWEPGTEPTVFHARSIDFATPICFEDTFGGACRDFVRQGARCLVNVSNDSWSSSRACQMQHLAMAVFRSAENRVPSVRSTASGVTCLIDGMGRVYAEAPQFAEAAVAGEVLVPDAVPFTPYTRWGDWLPRAECAVLLAFSLFRLVARGRQNKVK